MNGSEYVEFIRGMGLSEDDFIPVQPASQSRIWNEMGDFSKGGADRAIGKVKEKDPGFNLDKAITGGSDAHSLNHLGRAVTYLPGKIGREEFLDAVKEGNVRVMGKELNIFRKMTSHSTKLRSNLRNTPDLVEKNLRYGASYFNSKSKKLKENMRRSIMGKA